MWPLVLYLFNAYEDMYPLFKQEAAKKAGHLYIMFVFIVVCIVNTVWYGC